MAKCSGRLARAGWAAGDREREPRKKIATYFFHTSLTHARLGPPLCANTKQKGRTLETRMRQGSWSSTAALLQLRLAQTARVRVWISLASVVRANQITHTRPLLSRKERAIFGQKMEDGLTLSAPRPCSSRRQAPAGAWRRRGPSRCPRGAASSMRMAAEREKMTSLRQTKSSLVCSEPTDCRQPCHHLEPRFFRSTNQFFFFWLFLLGILFFFRGFVAGQSRQVAILGFNSTLWLSLQPNYSNTAAINDGSDYL